MKLVAAKAIISTPRSQDAVEIAAADQIDVAALHRRGIISL